MIGKLLKGAAYAKAPKKIFALLHPVRAAKLGAGIWLARKIFGGGRKQGQARA